jgi:hypothetical protein
VEAGYLQVLTRQLYVCGPAALARSRLLIVVTLALLGTVFGLATAPAWGLSRSDAEDAFAGKLDGRYGHEFESASASWLKCPREEIFDIDDDGYDEAICMAEFGSNHTRRYVSGVVDDDLTVKYLYARQWKRRKRRCRSSYLHEVHLHGRLWTNDRNCGGAALMALDISDTLQHHPSKDHTTAYRHGTNMAGFKEFAKLPCKIRHHDGLASAYCRSSLGDAFRFTTSIEG